MLSQQDSVPGHAFNNPIAALRNILEARIISRSMRLSPSPTRQEDGLTAITRRDVSAISRK